MKRFILFSLMIGLFACAKVNTEPEYVSVVFNPTYEGMELISEMPLTKAVEPNAVYGVAVYKLADNNNSLSYADRYCYGFYDDISLLEVQFKRNDRYCIMMQYFPNGKNDIPNFGEADAKFFGVTPWHISSDIEMNELVYSTQSTIQGILFETYFPYVQYGYMNECFVPTTNTSIPVHFYRLNAGLTIKFEVVDGFSYESVRLFGGDGTTYTADIANGEREIVINNIALGWKTDVTKELCDIYPAHYEIGTPDNPTMFFNGDIELKRNTMRTYTIKLQGDNVIGSMNVTYEEEPYGADNGGYLN